METVVIACAIPMDIGKTIVAFGYHNYFFVEGNHFWKFCHLNSALKFLLGCSRLLCYGLNIEENFQVTVYLQSLIFETRSFIF